MSDVVIRAESLGKKYLIGHQSAERERYTALRDTIGRQAQGLLRSAGDLLRGRQIIAADEVEEFWALKDVSFEVKRGEVVGIIGRNGAGKSTLLKILSRITEPSAGRVEIKGRVASLLEVGTGFHPELTGRENIYLNGAILGMSRAEIRRKFDEIVAFAEVERFLDTPVKRYSSGMYVRLAFAVAAHMDPEVLVVDEVLAVGDAEFQKKCMGKMGEVAGEGRTVLFVSHNMGAISDLCQRAVLLKNGRTDCDGPAQMVIDKYYHLLRHGAQSGIYKASSEKNIAAQITAVELLDGALTPTGAHVTGEKSVLKFTVSAREEIPDASVLIEIRNARGARFLKFESPSWRTQQGVHSAWLELDRLPITPGEYLVSVGLAHRGVSLIEYLSDILLLAVRKSSDPQYDTGCSPSEGYVTTIHHWKLDIGSQNIAANVHARSTVSSNAPTRSLLKEPHELR